MSISKQATKKIAIISSIACAFIAVFTLVLFYVLPSTYVSLDVNPSIEMHLNRLGNVVDIRGANADAETLLAEFKPSSKESGVVMEELIILMTQKGYIAPDKQNDILITVEESADSAKTLEKLSAQVKTCLTSQNLDANLILVSQKIDAALEKAAEENGVSAGKMSVIERLVSGDATLNPKDLAEMRVSDLMKYISEKGISTDMIEEHIDALEDIHGDSPELDALEDAIEEAEDAAEEPEEEDDEDDDKDDKGEDDDKNSNSINGQNTAKPDSPSPSPEQGKTQVSSDKTQEAQSSDDDDDDDD